MCDTKSIYLGFDAVIDMLKKYEDTCFTREGWCRKDMYITLQKPDENSKMTQPYIYLKLPDDKIVPWVASQSDLLEDDWYQLAQNEIINIENVEE